MSLSLHHTRYNTILSLNNKKGGLNKKRIERRQLLPCSAVPLLLVVLLGVRANAGEAEGV